jgi:hypothetical protein
MQLKRKVALDSIVAASSEQISSDLSGEVIILDLSSGVYYGLDSVGARIWNLLQVPRSVIEIRNVLLDEYDVEPDRCERDLLSLLEELLGKGLIEVRHETSA